MKLTYLGQAGLLFEKEGFKIMIDPYLSDSVEKINPANYRRIPVNNRFFEISPDIMIFTHNHLDHYDPETVEKFITCDSSITVLAPQSVWSEVRKIGGKNNYVLFNRHTQWSQNGFIFTAVKAEHSDAFAIGVIIQDREKKYYITGDTLYNTEIFEDIPNGVLAGKNAGMTVGCVRDRQAEDLWEETKSVADFAINDYEEVMGIFINQ